MNWEYYVWVQDKRFVYRVNREIERIEVAKEGGPFEKSPSELNYFDVSVNAGLLKRVK